MTSSEVYRGETTLLDQETAFSVESFSDVDGTKVRELTFDRPPLMPSELYRLMEDIAPQKAFGGIRDVKGDMQLMLVPKIFDGPSASLKRQHTNAFGQYWDIMQDQARVIYDALPYKNGTDRLNVMYGESNLKKLILSIRHNTHRNELLERFKAGERVTDVFQVEDDHIGVPDTPIVTVPREDGRKCYVKTASLDLDGSRTKTSELGITADGVLKVVHDKVSRRIPIWQTYHVPNRGIVPRLAWRVDTTGECSMIHESSHLYLAEHAGDQWSGFDSTVIGTVALASLTPEITTTWRSRQGFRPNAPKTQSIGPLQATLLSVMLGDKLLNGPFIQHIEDALEP